MSTHNIIIFRLRKTQFQKIVSEYDQEIPQPQPQTADKPMAPRGRITQPSQDTIKTNLTKHSALSSPSRSLLN